MATKFGGKTDCLIIKMLAAGETSKEIASAVGLTQRGLRYRVHRYMVLMGLYGRADATKLRILTASCGFLKRLRAAEKDRLAKRRALDK